MLIRSIKTGFVALVIGLFIGFSIFAAAIGAFVPSIYKISEPVLCQGKFTIESRSYSYRPGQVGVEHKIYCDRRGGEIREDLTIIAVIVSGIIYSLILFPFIWIGTYLIAGSKKWSSIRQRNQRLVFAEPQHFNFSVKNNTQRLSELEKLKKAGLITEEEYKTKRKEILRDL
jgi:hypothetical protein